MSGNGDSARPALADETPRIDHDESPGNRSTAGAVDAGASSMATVLNGTV